MRAAINNQTIENVQLPLTNKKKSTAINFDNRQFKTEQKNQKMTHLKNGISLGSKTPKLTKSWKTCENFLQKNTEHQFNPILRLQKITQQDKSLITIQRI